MHHPSPRMETRSKRRLGKQPLPGERQGTSGAGAGRDSVRATSGSMPMRRATTGLPEEDTAHIIIDPSQQHLRVNDGGSVARERSPEPTTLVPSTRQRTMWTDEMNEYVVRCYYRLTKLETSKEPFTADLHRLVVEKYPSLRRKTVQNIIDQRRSIFTNNRIAADRINAIKEEIAAELGMVENSNTRDTNDEHQAREVEGVSHHTKEEDVFVANYMKFCGICCALRPKLPKIVFKPKTNEIISNVNSIITDRLQDESPLDDLHTLVYVGAMTVLSLNGQHVNSTKPGQKKASNTPPCDRRLCSKIDQLRRNIGVLTQYGKPNASAKVRRAGAIILNRLKSQENTELDTVLDNQK